MVRPYLALIGLVRTLAMVRPYLALIGLVI